MNGGFVDVSSSVLCCNPADRLRSCRIIRPLYIIGVLDLREEVGAGACNVDEVGAEERDAGGFPEKDDADGGSSEYETTKHGRRRHAGAWRL